MGLNQWNFEFLTFGSVLEYNKTLKQQWNKKNLDFVSPLTFCSIQTNFIFLGFPKNGNKMTEKDRMCVLYLLQNVTKDRLSRKLLIYLLMGGFWETINFVQIKMFSISLDFKLILFLWICCEQRSLEQDEVF